MRRLLAFLLTVSLSAAACSGEPPPPAKEKPYRGTALADFDSRHLGVAREPFCDWVSEDAVQLALDGPARHASSYTTGDKIRLADGVKDVADEHACTFVGQHGTTARAWLFSPPVTPRTARRLVAEADRGKGCGALPGAAAYGRPTTGLLCRGAEESTVSFRGLFGDAWLSCSVAQRGRPDTEELADRAGRWCVAVAQAAAG